MEPQPKFSLGDLLGQPQTEEEKLLETANSFEGVLPPRFTLCCGQTEGHLVVTQHDWRLLSDSVREAIMGIVETAKQVNPLWSWRTVLKLREDASWGWRRRRRGRRKYKAGEKGTYAIAVSTRSNKVFGKIYDSATGGNRTVQIGQLSYYHFIELKALYAKPRENEA